MSYSNITNDLWDKFKTQLELDDYCTFSWDDEEMTNYHAFIVGSKEGSLKFHNGPSFSNSYSSPQFQGTHSSLTSISFKTMTISFTIGVYAFTAELYRKLLYKLSPYTIGNLIFDFQPSWRYVVKLASIDTSSPRYYLGKNSNDEDLYYTEFQVQFDIQGDAVALSTDEIGYEPKSDSENKQVTFTFKNSSELDTPFLFNFTLTPNTVENPSVKLVLQYTNTDAKGNNNSHTLSCFDLSLKHLNTLTKYYFTYDSQVGQLFFASDNTATKNVLNYLTYNGGYRIVESLLSQSRTIPGTFRTNVDWSNIQLVLSYSDCTIDYDVANGLGIDCYSRRNII